MVLALLPGWCSASSLVYLFSALNCENSLNLADHFFVSRLFQKILSIYWKPQSNIRFPDPPKFSSSTSRGNCHDQTLPQIFWRTEVPIGGSGWWLSLGRTLEEPMKWITTEEILGWLFHPYIGGWKKKLHFSMGFCGPRAGGGFKHPSYRFYFHLDPWGDDPFWQAYVSNGLVQPPTRICLEW